MLRFGKRSTYNRNRFRVVVSTWRRPLCRVAMYVVAFVLSLFLLQWLIANRYRNGRPKLRQVRKHKPEYYSVRLGR